MKRFKFWALAAMLSAGMMPADAIKVHTIGDSTMADYDENATVTRGWGMYLQQFLDGIEVNNRGKGGADTRGFYEGAAYWPTVKRQMEEGDYVLIQFAHNDEKNGGMDGVALKAYYESTGNATAASATDTRGTVPSTTYREYLRKFVEDTRALGGHPVLVSPVCRSYFSGSSIRRNGRHDLGDNFSMLTENGPVTGQKVSESDHSMDYSYQMQLVAEEMNIPFIDLTTATKELYESYGDSKCHELLFDGTGSTHFNTTGAMLVARLCAQLLKEKNILSDRINLTSDISVSPSDGYFGEAYTGQTLMKEFSLSGFSLSPANGTVRISASAGIQLSLDRNEWSDALSVSYTASTLIRTFYARIVLDGEAGEKQGTITIEQGGKTLQVPVMATAVSLGGGEEVTVYWRLESDDSYKLTGPATVVPESWTGMYVQRYANPNANTTWPEGTGFDASRKTQRNLIVGDTWPADDIDENPTRYIEFGVTAPAGMTLKIDSIGMYVGGAGGNGMRCHVNYSTDPSFANQHTIYAPANMVSNTMNAVSATPVISLEDGGTLLVRVYPWYNGAATGKTICLSDVTIHGYAMNASGIRTVASVGGDVVRKRYYSAGGTVSDSPKRGLNIVSNHLADGKVKVTKTLY